MVLQHYGHFHMFIPDNSYPIVLVRVVKTVFLENGVFVPCRKQVVLTKNGENYKFTFYPQKQGALLLRPRKPTKNDANGGCHSGKTTGCQKHRFRHPDLGCRVHAKSPTGII